MNNKKKLLIIGFFGEQNLGDETILKALLSHAGDATVTGYGVDYDSKCIKRRGLASWPAFLSALRSSDLCMLTGGILQDWSLEGTTFFALRIIASAFLGKPVSLWGGGLGPLRTQSCIKIATRSLKKVDLAWLRDAQSCKLFYNLTGTKCNLGADWSWNFPVTNTYYPDGPFILNLRSWPFNNYSTLISDLLNYIDRKVIGVALRPSDTYSIKQVSSNSTVLIPATFTDLASNLNLASSALTMRYHATLAALRAGVPTMAIAYDNKVAHLAADAEIACLGKNKKVMFKKASDRFISDSQKKYSIMQKAFKQYIKK